VDEDLYLVRADLISRHESLRDARDEPTLSSDVPWRLLDSDDWHR
jgi:hypothetical protein